MSLFSKTLSVSDHYPVEVELKTDQGDDAAPETTVTRGKTPKKGINYKTPQHDHSDHNSVRYH